MAWVVVVVQPGMVVDMVACKGVACKVACTVACMVVCMVSVVYMVSYPVFPFHLCRLYRLYRLYHPLVYIFSSCPSFSYLQSLLVLALPPPLPLVQASLHLSSHQASLHLSSHQASLHLSSHQASPPLSSPLPLRNHQDSPRP